MTKQEFIDALREKLSGLPKQEVDERIDFYSEIIDDMLEDGLSEADAVKKIGAPQDVAFKIAEEIPLGKIIKSKIRRKKRSATEIMLLAIGSPIWGSLLISVLAVIFSIYVSLWAVVISLWASELSFAVGAPCGLFLGCILAFNGEGVFGIFIISSGLCLAGFSILFFFVCRLATRGMIILTKRIVSSIKRCFVGKER